MAISKGVVSMALLTILKSNLKSKKGNFISIFIFVFIIALSLTTIINVSTGTVRRLQKSYKSSNTADITSFILTEKLTEDMLQGIKSSDGILNVEILASVASSKVNVDGKVAGNWVFMMEYNPKVHPYQIYNKKITGFQKDKLIRLKQGEVFVPVSFQNLYHCNLGDQLQIKIKDGEKEFKIAGFIEDPFVGSSMIGLKEIFLCQEDLSSLSNKADGNTLMKFSITNINVNPGFASVGNIKRDLNVNTGLISNSSFTLTKEEAKNYTLTFSNIISGILIAFAALLYIIILIIIGHTVSTGIEMDYVSLGILKSQGFTSVQIRIILVLQYLLAGLIGSMIGIACGYVTVPYVNRILLPVTGLLVGRDVKLLQSIVAMLVLLVMIVLYTYVKTRRILKVSPVQAISNGHAPVYFSNRADFAITSELPLPLSMKMVLKEITGNISRYVSIILIIGILVFFTMSITSLKQMSRMENIDDAFGSISSDIDINYDENTGKAVIDSVEADINKKDTIIKQFRMAGKYFTVDDLEYLGLIIDQSDIMQKPLSGRLPKYDNEIVITKMMSKEIGKGVGDTISLKYNNKQADYMIVGLNQYVADNGKNFFILLSGMKRLVPDYSFDSISYLIKSRDKSTEIVKYLKDKYRDQKDNIEIIDAYKETVDNNSTVLTAVNVVTAITYLLAILFAAIVSFMISKKLFLWERKNMGIYKSMGFTSRRLRGQFILRFILVVLLGGGVGLVCNLLWNDALMSLLLSGMGISHFTTRYSVPIILIPILCIGGFSTLFSFLVSRKIKLVSPKNLIQE